MAKKDDDSEIEDLDLDDDSELDKDLFNDDYNDDFFGEGSAPPMAKHKDLLKDLTNSWEV